MARRAEGKIVVTAVPVLPSYVSGVSEVPLLGDTIGDNFDRTAARHGGREVLVDCRSGRRWTYSQLRVEVDAMAHGLLAAGIEKGDRVDICYGMTETSPVSTQTRADDTLDRWVSTVSRVHPYLELKIVDPDTGLTVPRGTPGELCTRGYFGHARLLAQPAPRTSWTRRWSACPTRATARSCARVVDEFPMTVTGKIRKVEMRERSVALLGLADPATTKHA